MKNKLQKSHKNAVKLEMIDMKVCKLYKTAEMLTKMSVELLKN